MEKLRSFEELFQRIVDPRIKRGDKFLGIFHRRALEGLEELFNTDFGTRQGRKMRPFVGSYKETEKSYRLVFLSTKNYSRLLVELKFCERGKRCEKFLYTTCFVLKDRNRRKTLAYSIPEEKFKNFSYELCGFCEDLEHLDNLGEIR
ncbi:MAG: hypothetical protein NZ526_07205 [Aquificaceae bacterium]|nr:hypothetical protein [Aquificaceae bacterium]